MNSITKYKKAGYPALAIETFEDQRFAEGILAEFQDREIFLIAATGGLRDLRQQKTADPQSNYSKALAFMCQQEDSFLLMLDFQHIVGNAQAYRNLLDAVTLCKMRGNMILLLAPSWQLPAELQHEIPVLQDKLPETDELASALDVILDARKEAGRPVDLSSEQRMALLQSARGLTRGEAENAFALAAGNGLEPHAVETEKMRLVKSKCMSVEQPQDPNMLGGLGELKRYIDEEVIPAKDDDQLRVRGILKVGIPGTGKSLGCKAIAAKMHLPLVRLDISAAKGSLVGESEAALRHALATVDAVAPCVIWIDEIEKAVGGYSSSAQTDGGTTLGMVGALLTWLQEHTSPVLVVATCNDYQKLPPEMTRAGRFDERFFLDLPTGSERVEIAKIHLAKLGVEIDGLPAMVAKMTQDWTGAEIEQLIKSAARRTKRKVTGASLEIAAQDIIPISRSANVQALRDWAKDHLRRANDSEGKTAKAGREIG